VSKAFDIAIIGGGVIGLALGRELLAAKLRVIIIDAGDDIPAATNAAAGMLAPSFEMGCETSEVLYRFSAASLSLWPEFSREVEDAASLSVDYRDDGILGVALDEPQWQELRTRYGDLEGRGAKVEMLSGDEARGLEPALSSNIAGALFAPFDAQVDPRKLLLALRVAFLKSGGMFSSERVSHIKRAHNIYVLRTTSGAPIEADKIVIASGAAALSKLLVEIVCDLPPLPVRPVKGEAVALDMGDLQVRHVVRAPGAYICPKAGARMIIGATEIESCESLDVDPSAIAGLIRNGERAVSGIAKMREMERWAGLRPATPDGAPILGRYADGPDDVFLALGHHRNGILLAPASAKALAAEITGNQAGQSPALTLKPFSPDRFQGAAER